MNLKQIAIGTKIEISPIVNGSDMEISNHRYVSQVLDITDDEMIKVAVPIHKGKIIILSVNYEYDVCFFTSSGMYRCQANIIDRYKSNNILIMTMELTSPLSKYQRREYYRLDCLIDMKYVSLESDSIDDVEVWNVLDKEESEVEGVIVDISGGGTRFVSEEKLEENHFIIMLFNLHINGEDKKFTLIGQVISSKRLENRIGQFEIRCKFIRMNKVDREAIVRYIFEQERRKRIKK